MTSNEENATNPNKTLDALTINNKTDKSVIEIDYYCIENFSYWINYQTDSFHDLWMKFLALFL